MYRAVAGVVVEQSGVVTAELSYKLPPKVGPRPAHHHTTPHHINQPPACSNNRVNSNGIFLGRVIEIQI